ncbi:LamG-like jellyroll fold domain-containing protein [Amycolatopsis sp. cg5]|uniref:LamG-like jellyroll fold domain-containing protein n=1 Tax=Amycolatopsis sp. cg5 TaxID=3238802 RepID=UPI003525BB99
MRRRLCSLLGAALAAGLLSAPAALAAPPPAITEHATTAGAAAAARASGKQVEALDQRTETTQVFAEPDGSMKREQALSPVRARKGDGWAEIDTKLARQADVVAPGATSIPVEFSAGGKTPVVRFGAPGKRFSLTWPKELPAPALDQETATYPEVYPGVDLKVVAKRDGFSHSLIVKTPEAAKNPELKTVRFGLETEGISLRVEKTGAITAVDDREAVVFQAPTPQMWDSSGKRERAVVKTEVAAGKLVLIPDQAMLTDPATVFPVEIDPDWTPGVAAFALTYAVPAAYRGNNYWNGDGDNIAKVGFSDYDSPKVHVRSYFQWNITDLRDKGVLSASVSFLESWSPSCTKKWVELYRTTKIDGGTSWNNGPTWLAHQDSKEVAHGHSSSCPQDWVGFNVSGGVAGAVAEGQGTVTFMLRAPGRTEEEERADSLAWKKFKPWDTKLTVTYNDHPYDAYDLYSEPKHKCAQADDAASFISTANPILVASANDPNGDRVQAEFQWRERGDDARPWQKNLLAQQNAGSDFRMKLDDKNFVNGKKYEWRVAVMDAWGAWSFNYGGPCKITLDTTAPDKPPLVSSVHYPERGTGPDGGAPGQTGQFHFDANGVADVAEFRYRLSGADFRTVPAVGGKATALITPLTEDPHTLEVTSVDAAGNMGNEANTKKYEFRVGVPTPPSAHWRLDGHAESREVLDARGVRNGTLPDGIATWTSGRVGKGLRTGGNGGFPVGTTPSTTTTVGFSVSAWVRVDGDFQNGFHTAVSQDGKVNSGFALGYHGESKAWSFFMATRDGQAPNGDWPNLDYALAPAKLGVWTHLTGVHNPSEQRIVLYVNGIEAASVPHTSRWSADGPPRIGGGQWAGAFGDTWPGRVDEVRTYRRALSDLQVAGATEIDKLAGEPAVPESTLTFDEGTGATSTEIGGSFRQATLSHGAAWGPGRNGTQGMVISDTGIATVEDPVVPSESSYTVSAWALPKALDTTLQAVLSADAPPGIATELAYDGSRRKWVFRVAKADFSGWYEAVSNDAPHSGWTHLAGVFDAAAPELRLYADGVQIGVARLPDKPFEAVRPGTKLRIGGAWSLSRPTIQFRGTIDEVRVFRGVRTEDEISDEYRYPLPNRTPSRMLSRYVNTDTEFYTTNAPDLARDYRLQLPLGQLVPVGTPDTRLLYSCYFEKDTFTSVMDTCEGQRKLGVLGAVYVNPPAGLPTLPLYRCLLKTGKPGEHFESPDAGCEGHTKEGLLGYTLAYGELIRYLRTDGGKPDHTSEVANLPPGYLREGSFGRVPLAVMEGTVPLRTCKDGTDIFSSTDANCEGKTQVKVSGWIWTSPPAGVENKAVYRCATNTESERFDSSDPACAGNRVLGLLGYVATMPSAAVATRAR